MCFGIRRTASGCKSNRQLLQYKLLQLHQTTPQGWSDRSGCLGHCPFQAAPDPCLQRLQDCKCWNPAYTSRCGLKHFQWRVALQNSLSNNLHIRIHWLHIFSFRLSGGTGFGNRRRLRNTLLLELSCKTLRLHNLCHTCKATTRRKERFIYICRKLTKYPQISTYSVAGRNYNRPIEQDCENNRTQEVICHHIC